MLFFLIIASVACFAKHSDDSLGYSSENPIKVGIGVYGGPANEAIYLKQLIDVKGRQMQFARVGSCCPFKPSNGMPSAMLDIIRVYFLTGNVATDSVQLYLTFYDYAKPVAAPEGFQFKTNSTADSLEINQANVLRRYGKDTILRLSFDKMESVPAYVWNLKQIKELSLGYNSIKVLPAEIRNLKSLRELELQSNPLRKLPKEIAELDSLEVIQLGGDMDWDQVFEALAGCERLHTIVWWDAGLKEVPKAVVKCQSIRNVNLKGNGSLNYAAAFKTLAQLRNLNEITIGSTSDKSLSGIDALQSLKVLNIENSGIKELPSTIGNLKSLEELHFRYCREIRSLPAQVSSLKNLKALSLYSCDEDFDYESALGLFEANDLRYLDISQSWRLKRIPPVIFQFSNLRYLGLNIYETDSIQPEIGNLTKLEEIVLGPTDFKYLPKEFGKLKSLKKIDLHGRVDFSFEQIFPVFSELENLEEIDLNWGEQRLPDSIARLKKIKTISLTNYPRDLKTPAERERLSKLLPGCEFVF